MYAIRSYYEHLEQPLAELIMPLGQVMAKIDTQHKTVRAQVPEAPGNQFIQFL